MSEDSSHLCVTCAMCCSGAFFQHVTLEPGEEAAFAPEALTRSSTGKLAARLLCQHIGEDGRCGCYAVRPKSCGAFRCRTLRRVESGEFTKAQALEVVDEAKTFLATYRKHLAAAVPDQAGVLCAERPSRALRLMKRALAEAGRERQFHATQAEVYFGHYRRMIRTYFSSKYGD